MIFCLLCILLFTVWQEAAISDGTLRSTQNSSTGTATYYLWNAKKKPEGVVLSDGTSTAYAYLPGQPGTWDEVLTVSIPTQDGVEAGAKSLLLFLQNHQSSVVGTTETSNPLLSKQLFTYLAYGEPQGTSPESLPLAGIGYTGRQHDDTGLIYYRGRYRDSCTGSFIQEDPKRDGWNWYGYSNDPVNFNNPSVYFGIPDTFNYAQGAPDFLTQQQMFSESGNVAAILMAQIAVGSTPIVGDLYDASIAVSGYDVIAQQQVSAFDRTVSGSCATIGGSFGAYKAMEHIMYRHGADSIWNAVNQFAKGTTPKDIMSQVDEALRHGTVINKGNNALEISFDFTKTIGLDKNGNATSNLKVHVRDGVIGTAFPY